MDPQETIKIPVESEDIPVYEPAPEHFNFYKAFESIGIGMKVKRLEWPNEEYGILKDGFVMIHKPDGKFYNWNISDGDLMAKDWIIIN